MSTGEGNEPLLIELSAAFRKDAKRMRERGKDLAILQAVAEAIAAGVPLEERHRDHALRGNYRGSRECHLEPDWLLIYAIDGGLLRLIRTGTHSDLFRA